MVLEIFAGTARLSRAIRDVGMSAMAVDKDSQRAQSVHIATYALSDFIVKHSHMILWAHFAPSCGTASRARGRPLPKLAKMSIKVPQPLRSDSQPMGMDGLSGLDKIKAECVNITYENTCELMRLCIKLGIAVSLENPRTPFEGTFGGSFSLEIGGYNTIFDNCCHGGARKKATSWCPMWLVYKSCCAMRWLALPSEMECRNCGWSCRFSDPLGSCIPSFNLWTFGNNCKTQALELGATKIHDLAQQTEYAPSSQHRFLLEMLPKGRKFKPLVSEYGRYENGLVTYRNFCWTTVVQGYFSGRWEQ